MPHSRTDTEKDDLCLRYLPGNEYKTYRYLVNRADPIGICYPKQATIAEAIGCNEREVQRALEMLHENGVFRYRRRNAVDPDSRQRLHNVYQLNPLLLALAPECEAEAWSEWDALILKCGNISIRLLSRINQHQEPIPRTNSMEPVPRTSTKQPSNEGAGRTVDYTNQLADGESKKPKRKKQNPDREANQRTETSQRGEDAPKSSVPPRPQYANPESINTNLPDERHERLASDIRHFGIAMPLARGFIAEYGYERCYAAFKAVKNMGQKARQPGAVFRSIVQIRLADEFSLAHEKLFQNRTSSGG